MRGRLWKTPGEAIGRLRLVARPRIGKEDAKEPRVDLADHQKVCGNSGGWSQRTGKKFPRSHVAGTTQGVPYIRRVHGFGRIERNGCVPRAHIGSDAAFSEKKPKTGMEFRRKAASTIARWMGPRNPGGCETITTAALRTEGREEFRRETHEKRGPQGQWVSGTREQGSLFVQRTSQEVRISTRTLKQQRIFVSEPHSGAS